MLHSVALHTLNKLDQNNQGMFGYKKAQQRLYFYHIRALGFTFKITE